MINSRKAEPIAIDIDTPKMHVLTKEQQQQLELAKREFKCYTKYGLGKTNIEEHNIDTGDAPGKKMRYYPIFKAVQKLTYDELDRMLSLNVIEPATQASWNNRKTLVIKRGN